MPQQHTKLTRACADLIKRWHERYGIERASTQMDENRFFRYRELVGHFNRVDMSDPLAQREIAREQRSRDFEWAYVEPIPVELWRDVIRRYEIFDHRPPEHLGAAARWILDSLEPVDVAEPPHEAKPRTIVEAETRERLLEQAREFYADIVAQQRRGIGGLNVLISCSLERYPWEAGRGRTTLVRPEVIGLRVKVPGERSDDFIDAIRQGELTVEATTGGPTDPLPRPSEDDDYPRER